MVASMAPDTVFQGRYRVVRAINAGGMGAVYEVVDATTNARRALKVMLPGVLDDLGMRARFALEARVTGEVESDHLVRIFDAGVDEASGTPFLVMELLAGEDLAALLKRRGPLPPDEVVAHLAQVARGLDKTHAAGIVHRDLKPENLFLTRRDDGTSCLKILDYGIAKVVAPSGQTQGTQPIGTPLYMAPEQIKGAGPVGPPVDVYALGHIAYTLLVGEAYWDEEKRGSASVYPLLTAIVGGPAEAATARALRRRGVELPSGFDAWFARVTAADPSARFPRATEAVAALGAALETPTARMIEVVAEVAAEGRGDWVGLLRQKPPVRLLLAGAAVILLGIGALLAPGAPEPAPAPARPKAELPEEQSGRLVEDALWLVGLEDYEGAHLKLMGIPEGLKPTEDPRFLQVEAAWVKWKLDQVEKAAETAAKRALLREILMTETVDAKERKKALELLQALEGK
jgi:hypothetical protein